VKFSLSITLDNASFEGLNRRREVARILRWLAQGVDAAGINHVEGLALTDTNGNTVGEVTVGEADTDLLTVLEDTAEWIKTGKVDGVGFDEQQVIEQAHTAIAKARGQA